jgi:hypothetical protein
LLLYGRGVLARCHTRSLSRVKHSTVPAAGPPAGGGSIEMSPVVDDISMCTMAAHRARPVSQ